MRYLSLVLIIELGVIFMLSGTGTIFHRISSNWKIGLSMIIIYPIIRLIMKKPKTDLIESIKKNSNKPPYQFSPLLRKILIIVALIFLSYGLFILRINIPSIPFNIINCTMLVSFILATCLLFLSFYDPISDTLSWKNLK